MRAAFIDERERWRKAERRSLKVEHTPSSAGHIGVPRPLDERSREQISGPAAPEVSNRGARIGKRQMNQTVAADDKVRGGKLVARHVGAEKTSTGRGVNAGVSRDQIGDDIHAGIRNSTLRENSAHPVQ